MQARVLLRHLSTSYRAWAGIEGKGGASSGGTGVASSGGGASRKLRVAIIGQSQFGVDVYRLLRAQDHTVVGVFTVPDVRGRPDPLAQAAAEDNVVVHKFARWRKNGAVIPEVLSLYRSVACELNILPFCTQFIPMDVITFPKHQSICYHPSLLPRHRGASAINWTLIQGDRTAGFSVFWADAGLDTGPVLLQRSCPVERDDTVDSLYARFLYPEGVRAMGEAVQLVADGRAPRLAQGEEGATYDPIVRKEDAEIRWDQPVASIHNFIRGHDRQPGAWARVNNTRLSLYGSTLWTGALPPAGGGREVEVAGGSRGLVHPGGMLLWGGKGEGGAVNVENVWPEGGRMMRAADFGADPSSSPAADALTLSESELAVVSSLREIWARILGLQAGSAALASSADFFALGAGSMEVTRLVEEIRVHCGGMRLRPEQVYMAPSFDEMVRLVVMTSRGEGGAGGGAGRFSYAAVEKVAGGRTLRFPRQIFIDNTFSDSSDGATFPSINPLDESIICEVARGTRTDVDRAVGAAGHAFRGEWGRGSARERGRALWRLADLMEEEREELAALESIDSGAVYTLALKTHVGMSIEAFRYFAGWADKIEGRTIPVTHARPGRNLTYTRREPIGVCGVVTPWNYPLMMLAWKLAACLAAGNTVVLKPAQVTPLTSLKFGELVARAGLPPGVVNIVPGSGTVVGQALAEHPDVRKLGFTGSTAVGRTVMAACASSNLKRVSLELGGKSPLILFSDCDLVRAIRSACSAVFFNKGENCIAAGRVFVAESILARFLEGVVAEVERMRVGDPLDPSTDHGPQNHAAHLGALLEYVRRGVGEGATLVCGGGRVPDMSGLFMQPTVLSDVTDAMFVAREESFGPIMLVSSFSEQDSSCGVDSVLRRANASQYGLASGVFTRDLSRALSVAERLEAGTVFVNTYNKTDVAAPFGGFKQSGFGKDLGEEALGEYLQTKAVTIEY